MKIGVEVQIDVKKIEKARLYAGAKGTYLTMTTFIDVDEKDQYDNNGFIAHKKGKDEEGNPPILGNVKVFWSDNAHHQNNGSAAANNNTNAHHQNNGSSHPTDDFEDSIPF